jgi:hypothetical protein
MVQMVGSADGHVDRDSVQNFARINAQRKRMPRMMR